MKCLFECILSMLPLALLSCQKEDFSFTENEAKITSIVETGVGRNDGSDAEKFPYRIYFTLDAVLSDITDIREWGVYFVDTEDKPIEFKFTEVSQKGSIKLYLNTKPEYLHKGNMMSDIAVDRRIGLYFKKPGKKGDIQTYYGNLKTYSLKYEFPSTPSVEYSNPKIVNTEVIHVNDDGTASERRYKTTYSYDITIRGSFWIDYLESALSSGWSWNDESHFFYSDGTYSRSDYMSYSPGKGVFSQWIIIHCHDTDQTIESKNWLNFSGDSSISKIEVSNYERNI